MPVVKKESVESGKPRPRPRPRPKYPAKTEPAREVESPPRRTYAKVVATPSPPRHAASHRPRDSVPERDLTPAERHAPSPLSFGFVSDLFISVLEISDLSEESTLADPKMFVVIIHLLYTEFPFIW
jgi:hypothetical protein